MLKLKSVVKTREQLLATGWVVDRVGSFNNKEVAEGNIYIKPEMLGLSYIGIIKDFTHRCTLEGVSGIWTLHPEMLLLIDQWGFMRDPETLGILMFDVFKGAMKVGIADAVVDYPIKGMAIESSSLNRSYTKGGLHFSSDKSPALSKYPYSLEHGGYVPFNFEELKEALGCPKETELASPVATEPSVIISSDHIVEVGGSPEVGIDPSENEVTYEAQGFNLAPGSKMTPYEIKDICMSIKDLTSTLHLVDNDTKLEVNAAIRRLIAMI